MPSLSVVVPVYNEEPAIVGVVEELDAVLSGAPEVEGYEILVVDDGSTDGTAEVVRVAAEERPSVRLLARERNRGYGAAIKHGIRHAAHELLAIVDGDGSYPVEKLPEMPILTLACAGAAKRGHASSKIGIRRAKRITPHLSQECQFISTPFTSHLQSGNK